MDFQGSSCESSKAMQAAQLASRAPRQTPSPLRFPKTLETVVFAGAALERSSHCEISILIIGKIRGFRLLIRSSICLFVRLRVGVSV